jgi:hypothetical protein
MLEGQEIIDQLLQLTDPTDRLSYGNKSNVFHWFKGKLMQSLSTKPLFNHWYLAVMLHAAIQIAPYLGPSPQEAIKDYCHPHVHTDSALKVDSKMQQYQTLIQTVDRLNLSRVFEMLPLLNVTLDEFILVIGKRNCFASEH